MASFVEASGQPCPSPPLPLSRLAPHARRSCFPGPAPAPALGPAPALKRKRYLVKELYQILMKLYPAKAFPFQSWGHCPRPDMGRPPGAGNVQPAGPARETRGVTFVNLIRKTAGQSDP